MKIVRFVYDPDDRAVYDRGSKRASIVGHLSFQGSNPPARRMQKMHFKTR